MKLNLNGTLSEFQDVLNVDGLLENLKIEPGRVAVEVNMAIVKKQDYEKAMLKEGDSVEIVNFVGGG
ncbi:MAG TPA: sulfur carrier protein ThiS [Nitrospirae bacterium]|nr:sulfur carrier protein ThiS [Nitrospirota bacterium]